MEIPEALNELLDWRFPDALWVSFQRHSRYVYTVWIMDLDYSYNEYLACLSFDNRWTLSPRSVRCYDFETQLKIEGNEDAWRRGRGRDHRR